MPGPVWVPEEVKILVNSLNSLLMSFEIEGKLVKKFDVENKTSSFQAREFVIETVDGSYSQFIKFQLVQDRVSLVDAFQEGERIKGAFWLAWPGMERKIFYQFKRMESRKSKWCCPRPSGRRQRQLFPFSSWRTGYFWRCWWRFAVLIFFRRRSCFLKRIACSVLGIEQAICFLQYIESSWSGICTKNKRSKPAEAIDPPDSVE